MSVDRGFTWMEDETITLIDIFSKEEIQRDLSTCKRNISVYERIARELLDAGYRRTAYQCREKIKRLRKEYHLAKYCMEHDIVNKKPMKHFELVDKIFNRDSSEPTNSIDFGLLSSDLEDELHFSFTQDPESDTSNSCSGIESVIPQVILPGPSCSPIHDNESTIASIINSQNSPSNTRTDSDDAFLLNGEQTYNCSDSPLHDSESPWVPNVVLVENDLGNSSLGNCSENVEALNDILHENGSLHNFPSNTTDELSFEGSEEPPQKRKKGDMSYNWFKKMLESVTDTFLKYHETAECRFLARVTQLEQERMKRDEKLQKLWIEFEERRRKDEQQHELKMMSLLGQLVRQINENDDSPWAPDVLLVEGEETPDTLFENPLSPSIASDNGDLFSNKKRRLPTELPYFKTMLETLTLKLMKYQTESDARILSKIEELENERTAMDERMQKMWMEFEEKRRNEEREHELNIMRIFHNIVNQLNVNNVPKE